MKLDKTQHYIFQIGSNNHHRLYWDGKVWQYEFFAGGVLFDQLVCENEDELENVISVHGITLDHFKIDSDKASAKYSQEIREKEKRLTEAGIDPCPKHGLVSKNMDNTCEACVNTDYPDDHKGTEG